MQPNSELGLNTDLNLILNSVYVLYFNLNCVFLCFLFFVFPSFFLLFPFEFWSKWKLFLNPILHFIYISLLFDLSFLLPSFLFLVLSFLFSLFPQVRVVRFYHSCSPPPPPRLAILLLLLLLLLRQHLLHHLCLHFHVHCCLANSSPSSSPTSELSVRRWTSTWDLPS